MQLVDKNHQIYSFELSDLTFGDIRRFSNFRDHENLEQIAIFYREDEDKIFVRKENPRFCIKILELLDIDASIDVTTVPHYKSEVVQLLIGISKRRKEKQKEVKKSEIPKNPNNRFIEVDDSIIQASKIISVKPYGDRSIDIMTTGRNASVRKVYPSSMIRDFELSKLKKLILETA